MKHQAGREDTRRAPGHGGPTAVLLAVLLTAFTASAQPAAEGTNDRELLETAQRYLEGENSLMVVRAPSDVGVAVDRATDVRVASAFAEKRRERTSAKLQQRELSRLGEVYFSGVTTRLELQATESPSATERVLYVDEHTTYPFADNAAQPYEYELRHRITFRSEGERWLLADIQTESHLGAADPEPRSPEELEKLQALTREQLALARKYERSRLTANAAKRRSDARLQGGADGPLEQELRAVPGTCYSCAANWALRYAKNRPVDYTRDANDCTTFVSFAMYHGRWPEKSGFYRSNDAWWYNCDWCRPRHSYPWGGAQNFKNFIYRQGRVTALSNVWQVGLADIIQYDVKRYGGVGTADHTMIVTAFDTNGRPLLSYHTDDTRNKPLILVLQSETAVGQTFWAHRT